MTLIDNQRNYIMKKIHHLGVALLLLLAWGCNDDSTPVSPPTGTDDASAQKQFVWNAMNFWYYWQGDVRELGDNYFETDQAFQEYLKGFSDAQAVFNAVQYSADDFSFFIENYEDFQQSQKGISKSFGYQFGLVCIESTNAACEQSDGSLIGYVQYVAPDSPADNKNLKRGDIFTRVDGSKITVGNYRDLLLGKTSYELTLADIEGQNISETGETVSLQAVTLQEDPVYNATRVLQVGSTKIGYLMYNAFQLNSHQRLNEVFGTFASEGVDELVIDLRYNGGGTGITSQMLGSMISGFGTDKDFATYQFNQKRSAQNETVTFLDKVPLFENGEQVGETALNSVSPNRVYFLVDQGTASASEMLINSLKPYMDVILIGQQTTGKDEGSYTLYDSGSPYFDEESANPNHKIAIQPIVLKLVNSNGQDYPNGFEPDYEVNEVNYLENLPPLGDKDEPLLAKAIALITGESTQARLKSTETVNRQLLISSHQLDPYGNRLYIQPPENP